MKQKNLLYYLLGCLVPLAFSHIVLASSIFDDVNMGIGDRDVFCHEDGCIEYISLGKGRMHFIEKPVMVFQSTQVWDEYNSDSDICAYDDSAQLQALWVMCSKNNNNEIIKCVKVEPVSKDICKVEGLMAMTEAVPQERLYRVSLEEYRVQLYTSVSGTEIFCGSQDCIQVVEGNSLNKEEQAHNVSVFPVLHDAHLTDLNFVSSPIDTRMGGGPGGGMWELRVSSSMR